MPTRHDRPASNMAAGPAEVDDASVIAWSREEPAQFAEIFRRYAPEVQRYVVRRLGSDAADDVVAETFLTAFRQRDGYDTSRACARPWLYGIASHMISRHRRAEIRGYRLLALDGQRSGDRPVHRRGGRGGQCRGRPPAAGRRAGPAARRAAGRAAAGHLE